MSIRLRLALWCTAVLGLALIVFSLLLYSIMESHLLDVANESIASRAAHIASTVRADEGAPPALQHVELPPIDAFESHGIYVQVLQPDGAVVTQSDNLQGRSLPVDLAMLGIARQRGGVFYASYLGAEKLQTYVQPLTLDGQVIGFVQLGHSYAETYTILDRLRLGLLGAGSGSLLLAGLIAWLVASSALRPVATLTQTARAIALSRGFSRRLPVTGSRDELGQMAVTFNEMLESLAEAYAAQQRFIADASHELRAPLTAVRANLELLVRQGEDLPAEERRALSCDAAQEAERMARLVGDLLSLARADAGQKVKTSPTELDRLLMDVYGATRSLAKETRLSVAEIEEVTLVADPDLIKQLILILVDNAIRYTPPGGRVTMRLRKNARAAILSVADTGIGIADEDRPHIFERFYRADRARVREKAGTGLGLAIAKWIVEQHGGDIVVESVPDKGSTFTVLLPLSTPLATPG